MRHKIASSVIIAFNLGETNQIQVCFYTYFILITIKEIERKSIFSWKRKKNKKTQIKKTNQMIGKWNFITFFGSISFLILLFTACSSTDKLKQTNIDIINQEIDVKKSTGGSSGMVQISDSSYLVVYDLKNFKKGVRLGMVILTSETVDVFPIEIDSWGEEGISSDLESICAIPGKSNEFLISESGNWQGKLGRIFHILIDCKTRKASVLSSFKFPLLNRNDFDKVGDQYEAIHCLPYSKNERIIILGERGGSECNPSGVLRWGLWNIKNTTLVIDGEGLEGIKVNAPGNWTNNLRKRSITDLYIDNNGIIWASASEDQGDAGPFYSVIYKLGMISKTNVNKPILILEKFDIGREIYGFKIEALSGPTKGINCTHTFGTEDEIYGGVLRPININLSY